MNLRAFLLQLTILSTFIFTVSSTGSAQWITSAQTGNFSDPATWSCNCVPATTDSVIIYDHTVYMDSDLLVEGGIFQIGVGPSVLVDANNEYEIKINGGYFINNGDVLAMKLNLDSGKIANSGNLMIDTLISRDSISNTGFGQITANFLFHMHSLNGNDIFINEANIEVQQDFVNAGNFKNAAYVAVYNNFENCNYPGNKAVFENNFEVCIHGDFINCGPGNSSAQGDSLTGDNGKFFLNGNSTNNGIITGNLTIYSGGGINFQNGFIDDSDINYAPAVPSCYIGIAEDSPMSMSIYPNPFQESFYIETNQNNLIYSVEIYTITGQLVYSMSNIFSSQFTIEDLNYLEQGLYTGKFVASSGVDQSFLLIKE
ncbi:MAG: T9SS type A sorting domain-containing protein [Crocinitomicaceae bacterium]|nr:T9SS type A sorting domain-containing protein [Crocinitomicaceae bacterium]